MDAIRKWTKAVDKQWAERVAQDDDISFYDFLESYAYEHGSNPVLRWRAEEDSLADDYYVRESSTCCGVSEFQLIQELSPESVKEIISDILDEASCNRYFLYFLPIKYLGGSNDGFDGACSLVEEYQHLPSILEELGFEKLMSFKNNNTDNLVVGYGIATPTHSYAHEG